MKKVLALVLAVAMVSTVAFAWTTSAALDKGYKKHSTTAGDGVEISEKTVFPEGVEHYTVYGNVEAEGLTGELKADGTWDTGKVSAVNGAARSLWGAPGDNFDISDMLFRAVTNDNYTVTNIKVTTGRSLLKNPAVSIDDGDEVVKLNFVKDLNNTGAKAFDVTFTLKGKGKMILSKNEFERYNDFLDLEGGSRKGAGDRVPIPNVRFKLSGTVGYGKVTVNLGDYNNEDLEDLDGQPVITGDDAGVYDVDLKRDVIGFKSGKSADFGKLSRSAGSFVADAILTEHYGEMTMEARVYQGDTLYLYVNNKPDRELLGRLADVDGDVDFFFFEQSSPSHITLNSNAKLIFEDTEEGDYVYNYVNGKLQPVGSYDEDEGCMVVTTRKLGQYITSGHELVEMEIVGSDDIENPDTGANDVVGIAAALAAVALVSAAAVSLKK